MTASVMAPPRVTRAPFVTRAPSASRRFRTRARFWVRRYGPAELACLVTMLIASVVAAQLTDSPPLLAASAIVGATVGFYGVLVTSVMREQLAVLPAAPGRTPRAFARSVGLLAAEFGVAEVADTFFLRPALMMLGVVMIGDPVWGLLAGKLVADVLFYVVSAVCYRLTERTGIRMPRLQLRAVRAQPHSRGGRFTSRSGASRAPSGLAGSVRPTP